MILVDRLTKEQKAIQVEINSNPIEGMSFEKYKKTEKEKYDLKVAKSEVKRA